jgi:undecaprenyl-phosphate 4-deoxy-4-formamido-L-arabinose transferase
MNLSIVVPVYESADCLPELARRVREDLGNSIAAYELILVNDGSTDDSWKVIDSLVREYDFITGINLRKNVGQDNAIMAGLNQVKGDVVIIMDDDLQHDPSDIPRLYETAMQGYDVVYARFQEKKQALWKNLGSLMAEWLARRVLRKPKHIYMSPYKAIRREVVEEIIKYDGPFSYIDGIIFTITSNMTQIPATHHVRYSGKSNYNLVRSIRVWLKLATSFSVIPLRIASIMGGTVALISFLMGFYFIYEALFLERTVEGWASLIVAVCFIGGIQLLGIGALGEYVGRIFMTMNRRPQYSIGEVRRHNDGSQASPAS